MNNVDKYILKQCGFREDFDPENRFDLKTKVEYTRIGHKAIVKLLESGEVK